MLLTKRSYLCNQIKIQMNSLSKIQNGEKHFAVLIDPDDVSISEIDVIVEYSKRANVSFFLVGGSLLIEDEFEKMILYLKQKSAIPVLIFPGDTYQISSKADGILLLSLISGRNSDLLIGKHVLAAPRIKRSQIEVLPTGYMLVDSGKQTTASYMSNSMPIPRNKESIAVATALAGELLGMQLIYMDGGSGAEHQISLSMIKKVKENISIPLIIGGGIKDAQRVKEVLEAGADMVVVGTAIEQNPELILEIGEAFR